MENFKFKKKMKKQNLNKINILNNNLINHKINNNKQMKKYHQKQEFKFLKLIYYNQIQTS